MEKSELLYAFFSLFIVFVMVFTHEYHVDNGVNKSRGYISAIFIGLLLFLIIISGIIFNIAILKNFFKFMGDTFFEEENIIHYVNLFRIVGIFFGITIIAIPFINNDKTLDKIKATIYGFIIFIYNIIELLKTNMQEGFTKTWLFIMLLLIVNIIVINLFLVKWKKNYKNFFNKDSYGYLCLGNNFQDVSPEEPLICPINNLQ